MSDLPVIDFDYHAHSDERSKAIWRAMRASSRPAAERELDHAAWENNETEYKPRRRRPLPWASIGIFGVWLAIIWLLVWEFRDFEIACARLWFGVRF